MTSSLNRFGPRWLLLGVPAGIAALVVGTYTLLALWPGEPAAAYLSLADSAPVPGGAVRYEHSATDGTVETGPKVRVGYHLRPGQQPSGACLEIVRALRAGSWTLRTWGQRTAALPDDVATFCAPADSAAVLFTAVQGSARHRLTVLVGPTGSERAAADLVYSIP